MKQIDPERLRDSYRRNAGSIYLMAVQLSANMKDISDFLMTPEGKQIVQEEEKYMFERLRLKALQKALNGDDKFLVYFMEEMKAKQKQVEAFEFPTLKIEVIGKSDK